MCESNGIDTRTLPQTRLLDKGKCSFQYMLNKPAFTVFELWRRLDIHGEPKAVCCCPFHPDKNASFSIYKDGQHWKCFAGCGSGDAIAFFAKATGLNNREAFRKLRELSADSILPVVNVPTLPKPEPKLGNPALPSDLHRGSPAELQQVATLRGLSLAGVGLASARGLLRFGRACGSPCWVVLDGRRTLAQARRMDGKPFPEFGAIAERKSHTIKGSRQSWPLGIDEANSFPCSLLVEGAPDLLAACHFIALSKRESHFAPVAMLGASNRLPADALALFRGKRVRIYPHADRSGEEAAAGWAEQIEQAGASSVDAFPFRNLWQADDQPVKDLNDAARMEPAAQPGGLLPR